MQGNLGKLFEPARIGPVEIKNRMAMAPMGIVGLVNSDGSLNQRGIPVCPCFSGLLSVRITY
jgi:2-enoate reductase